MNNPKPGAQQQALARQRAQLIMQVRSGVLSAQEAARQLGISRKTYYKWERRALAAMVEALGINVRQVFTFVFALGVGLAALGGVLAGPAMGVSDDMGESLLLSALIALAIGGLTSFPGAAAGSGKIALPNWR